MSKGARSSVLKCIEFISNLWTTVAIILILYVVGWVTMGQIHWLLLGLMIMYLILAVISGQLHKVEQDGLDEDDQ